MLNHHVNHVLIQLYRTGADYISEHSDKTIDIVPGSKIVNVSLGAQRVMTLRTKKDFIAPRVQNTADSLNDTVSSRQLPSHKFGVDSSVIASPRRTQRVPLPHNSVFVLGLVTNAKWTHSIHTDKRPLKTKSSPEQYQNGERISLTFRHIGTFLTPSPSSGTPGHDNPSAATALNDAASVVDCNSKGSEVMKIFGQGAKAKTKSEARTVVNGGEEAERLLAAFGWENKNSEFSWQEGYGEGFDVLHFTES